jgi:hypothetical protein
MAINEGRGGLKRGGIAKVHYTMTLDNKVSRVIKKILIMGIFINLIYFPHSFDGVSILSLFTQ